MGEPEKRSMKSPASLNTSISRENLVNIIAADNSIASLCRLDITSHGIDYVEYIE